MCNLVLYFTPLIRLFLSQSPSPPHPKKNSGLVDLVPPVPDAIKVCVFPPSFLLRSDLHVHPYLLNPVADTTPPGKAKGVVKGGFPFSLAQLMRWAFVAPQEDADIERLYALGQEVCVFMFFLHMTFDK